MTKKIRPLIPNTNKIEHKLEKYIDDKLVETYRFSEVEKIELYHNQVWVYTVDGVSLQFVFTNKKSAQEGLKLLKSKLREKGYELQK